MNKRQLKRLIKNYKNDISSGDLRNMDNLIAALVINDLTYLNDSIIEKYGISNISLALLLGIKNNKKYTIPSKYEINDIKRNYERNRKTNNYISSEEVAAITWIDIMLSIGMISENEKIIPSEYILNDYVTDYQLSQLLPIEYNKSVGNSTEDIVAGKGLRDYKTYRSFLLSKKNDNAKKAIMNGEDLPETKPCKSSSKNRKVINDILSGEGLSTTKPRKHELKEGTPIERIANGKGMFKSNEDIVRVSEGYGIPNKKDSINKILDLKKK